MNLDTVLNAAWLLLGLMALTITFRLTRRDGETARRRVWVSCAVVALITATLFPIVSATDDLLRIQNLQLHHESREPGQKPASDSLIRLYECMDMPLIATVSEVVLTLLFVCFLGTLLQRGIERSNPSAIGRSPPAFACF